MDYDETCKAAATRQGLDPITERLKTERIDYTVEQTGGFCMVAYAGVGHDLRMGFTKDGDYVICLYDQNDEWVEGTTRYVPDLDNVIAIFRAVQAATDLKGVVTAFLH